MPVCACLFAGGCVETGDFGRVKQHSTWNDIVSTTGTVAAGAREEPVSPFPLTDDEEDLRGRAWRFLTPAFERNRFARALAELTATRVLPVEAQPGDVAAYFRSLETEERRSPVSRYRRLSEDVAADGRLLGPLADVASRVLEADRVRWRTLDYAHEVAPADVAGARARIAENRCLVAWVLVDLDRRLLSYRYALEHLVIETPQADAVPPERALSRLRDARSVLLALGVGPIDVACAGAARGAVGLDRRQGPQRPVVRKG